MDEGQRDFSRRLKLLSRKHSSMTRGYRVLMKEDGLLVAAPAAGPSRLQFRPRIVVFLIGFLWLFKGVLIASLGTGYGQSIERLAAGTPVEQAGAMVMYPDPLAQWIAGQIRTTIDKMPV
jgi:hypothetical protein